MNFFIFLLGFLIFTAARAELDAPEKHLVEVGENYFKSAGIGLLEKTVNVNSGTMNRAGVIQMAALYESELKALGFTTSQIDLKKVGRGCHLIAEHKGSEKAPRFLLLGHLDTVFEKESGFLKYKDFGDGKVQGPGVSDMKGGNLVLLETLEALHGTAAFTRMNLIVALVGDEEDPAFDSDGSVTTSRGPLVELAKRSDYLLAFEPMNNTTQKPIIARRGFATWDLTVTAKPGHSSLLFSKQVGPGAIYGLSRVLARFYDDLRHEKFLTLNAGNIAGGTSIIREKGKEQFAASIEGKLNTIPTSARAVGDMRTLSADQLLNVRQKMRKILLSEMNKLNQDYTKDAWLKADLSFAEENPPMAPGPGNERLLQLLSQASEDLNLGKLSAADPMSQGAGDIAYLSSYVRASIDGLGPNGIDYHTTTESTDLSSINHAAQRAALLMYRIALNENRHK